MKWKDYLNNKPLSTQVSTRLYAIRKPKMTQEALAKKLNTKQPSIARLENGTRLPSLTYLEKIAKILGYKVIIDFEKVTKSGE